MTGESVAVHVNREGHGTVEAPAGAVERYGDFAVVVTNHGAPVHVHCRLDGDVAAVASVAESNVYVEADAETVVPVSVTDVDSLERPVSGTLEVATRYGAASTSIPLTVRPGPDPVDVDADLGTPAAGGTTGDRSGASAGPFDAVAADAGTLGVLALALVAVLVGTATAATIGGTTAVVAALVALVGLGAAVALLLGSSNGAR